MNTAPQKLSATKFAQQRDISVAEVQQQLVQHGYVEVRSGFHYFTDLGRSIGGEWRQNHPEARSLDGWMVWPVDLLADLLRK